MFRRMLLTGTLVMLLVGSAVAEEKKPIEPGPWLPGAVVGVNLSQSAFSSNWSGGDKGSIVWVLNADLKAERQFSRRFNLNNTLKAAFGQTARQITDPANPNRNKWDTPQKSTDLILFESVGRFTLDKYLDPYLAFRLDTQFLDESDVMGRSLNFNPILLKETAGFTRVFEKTEKSELLSRVGFGFRQSLARRFTGDTGDATVRVSTNDGGFEWQTDMTRPILQERVLYKGKLLVYLPVFYSQSGALKDFDAAALDSFPGREKVGGFWKAPDVNFQNTFTAQITKLLSVNLYLQAIYNKYDEATNVDPSLATTDPRRMVDQVDSGIRKAVQLKQTLAIGLSYALF